MSQTDGFIEEVSEEVRRDRLYGYLRRYGWIAVLAVFLLVGAASYIEWNKAQTRRASEAFGDEIYAALALEDTQERRQALAAIDPQSDAQAALLGLMLGAALQQEGATQDAQIELADVEALQEVDPIFGQIAQFKRLLMIDDPQRVEERREGFQALAIPGNPLRPFAQEQLALLELESGESDAAIERLQTLLEDSDISSAMSRRVEQILIALGEEPRSTLAQEAATQ